MAWSRAAVHGAVMGAGAAGLGPVMSGAAERLQQHPSNTFRVSRPAKPPGGKDARVVSANEESWELLEADAEASTPSLFFTPDETEPCVHETSASAGLQTSTQQAELLRLTRGILNDPAVQAAVLACAELRDYAQGLRNSGLLGPAPAPLALPLAVNKNVSLQEVEGANGPGPGQQLAELLNELRLLVGGALNALTAAAAAFLATTVGALGEALAALPGLLAPPPGPAEPMVRCSLTVVGDTVRLRLLTTADGAAGGEEEGGGEGAGPGKEDGRLAQTLAQAAVLLATAVIALLVLRRAPGRRKAF